MLMPTKNMSEYYGGFQKTRVKYRDGPSSGHHCSDVTPFSLSCLSQIKAGPKVLGPFCGERAPEPINTQSHSVQILFRSDNSGENRGWRLSYRATGNMASVSAGHAWSLCSALVGQWLRDEGYRPGTVLGMWQDPQLYYRGV